MPKSQSAKAKELAAKKKKAKDALARKKKLALAAKEKEKKAKKANRKEPARGSDDRRSAMRRSIDDRVELVAARARGRAPETPKRHQSTVVEFMKAVADSSSSDIYRDTNGLLVAHGMGSGKTLTALWVAKEYITNRRVDFVNILAPNVAVDEFVGSFERAGISPRMAGMIRVLTHDEFEQNKKSRTFDHALMIVDEAHMFTGLKYKALEKCDAPYVMLLTGTPAPNTPCEIVPLINLLLDRASRWTRDKWNDSATTEAEKKAFLKDKISMHNIGSEHNYLKQVGKKVAGQDNFPGYEVSTRIVKLTEAQTAAYLKADKKNKTENLPFYHRERLVVNAHPKRLQKTKVNVTPKVARVAKDVADEIKKTKRMAKKDPKRLGRGRLLLYAFNVDVTVDLEREIRRLCLEAKIVDPQIALYNGGTSESKRHAIKDTFNRGDLDLLIISKAGSVGLDLQCTSKVFLYDLWWNIPQMNQVIGRAIRFKSHQKPCKHTHVDVYIYTSKFATKQKEGMHVYDYQILLDAVRKWKLVAHMLENVMRPVSIKQLKSVIEII